MMDIARSKSVDDGYGNYLGRTRKQGEAWTKDDYQAQNEKGELGRQYGVRDWSRQHLNFEVVMKNGKPTVQPIDHNKPTLSERWQKRIDEGYKATVTTKDGKVHKKPIKKSEVKLLNFCLGGNRQRMLEMAFDGKPTLGKNGIGLNGHLHRKEDIEKWAVDCYNFLARKYGAENIIDFVVHLDETNPHGHVSLVPLTRDGKLSYTELFGGTHAQAVEAAGKNGKKPNFAKQMSEATKQLHTDFANEVGVKWGLERGDDIKITGAVHKGTDESIREKNVLEEQIARKSNSLLTLTARQTQLQGKVENLEEASRRADASLTAKNNALSAMGIKPVRPTLEIEDENERLKTEKEKALMMAKEIEKKAAEAKETAKIEGKQEARQQLPAEIFSKAGFPNQDGATIEDIADVIREAVDDIRKTEKKVENQSILLKALMAIPVIGFALQVFRHYFASPHLATRDCFDASEVQSVNNALNMAKDIDERRNLGKTLINLCLSDMEYSPSERTLSIIRGEVDRIAKGTHDLLQGQQLSQGRHV